MSQVKKIKFERCVDTVKKHLKVKEQVLFSKTRKMEGVDARHTLYKLCSTSSIRNTTISEFMKEKGVSVTEANVSASIRRINRLVDSDKDWANTISNLQKCIG